MMQFGEFNNFRHVADAEQIASEEFFVLLG